MRISKKALPIAIVVVLIFIAVAVTRSNHTASTQDSKKTSPGKSSPTQQTGFNKKQYSLTDPTSIWVVVNKQHILQPKDYAPADLVVPNVPLRVPGNESMEVRKVTASALEQLFAGAKQDGLDLMLSSGYRSYTYQVNLYGGYVQDQGQVEADKGSARPGYSEHQTGLAADIEPTSRTCEVETCFGDTPEGKWLAANAYKYGFIIRYPADKVAVTGYEYEPWHVRYVGTELSTELHDVHVETLEEFFGVKGGQNY